MKDLVIMILIGWGSLILFVVIGGLYLFIGRLFRRKEGPQ